MVNITCVAPSPPETPLLAVAYPSILRCIRVCRYGLLQASAEQAKGGVPYSILASGTDLIATMPDGSVASYDPGDM